MSRRWQLISLLAGAAATSLVWWWPPAPLWHSPPGVGRNAEFSPDGQTLLSATSGFSNNDAESGGVWHWDAATGKLLARTRFPCSDSATVIQVWPSPDGRLALVGEWPLEQTDFPRSNQPRDPTRGGSWYLHDGFTGERLTGPLPDVAEVGHSAFSDDGRWFQAYRHGADGKLLPGVTIFSAATASLVLDLQERDGWRPWSCAFAPDGASAAVISSDAARGEDQRHRIVVVELPSGRELRRFDLPRRHLVRVDRWDGELLAIVFQEPGGTQVNHERRRVVFDLKQQVPGEGSEDPLWREANDGMGNVTYMFGGPGALAQVRMLRRASGPDPFEQLLDWLAAKVGAARSSSEVNGIRLRVSFLDPCTGMPRYQLPRVLIHPCRLSPDGRLLVSARSDQGIEVWKTTPPRRWLKAPAAGVVAAGTLLMLGRWRRPRQPTLI
jgi:hypothetical protein